MFGTTFADEQNEGLSAKQEKSYDLPKNISFFSSL